MLSEMDCKELSAIEAPQAGAGFIPWELRSAEDYGDLAGQWLVVRPDFEEEIAGPFATRADCLFAIADLETARAEAHADPYPNRTWPEAEMN